MDEHPEVAGFTPDLLCPTMTQREREILVDYLRATPDQRRATLKWYAEQRGAFGLSGSLLHAMKWLFTA